VTRDDAVKLFDLLARKFPTLEVAVRTQDRTEREDTYTVHVRLDLPFRLSELEGLLSLIHHPGDLIPGHVEHEGHLIAQGEGDAATLWLVVTTKNGEDAKAV
jgi:hypothetical protein